ncbi:MAG TPA: PQQ-binding-like beta-propeller repeat protein, partial [Blastocatellia bacterium]|nr:PQQ-binding-like beta-propeller repeat protein [Blastocatellia bacterium]
MTTRTAVRMGTMLWLMATTLSSAFVLRADDDWSRFRGPNGTGISAATNLPVEFGPEQNVIWKTALPPGHSSPVLARNRIFVTAHTPITPNDKSNYRLLVVGLDRATGKELWRREIPRAHKGRLENVNGPASASPVTDGENVYAFFQDFGLIAFTGEGKEKWRLPLGPFNIFYGYGASPILVDDKIIVPVDQDLGSYLLAVDKNSGQVKWKTERPEVISGYSTPTVYQPPSGEKQLIVPESFQVSAYALSDGKRIWWVRGLACEMKSVISYDREYLYINGWGLPQNQPGKQIPTVPFADGLKRYDQNKDGFVGRDEISGSDPMDKMLSPNFGFDFFDLDRDGKLNAWDWDLFRAVMAAENGLLAIKLGGEGDMTDRAIRWKYQRPVPQVPSTLLYQGSLFMVNDSGI